MLTKRTNILFEDNTWKELVALAKKRNSSVGELVRKAIKKTYFSETIDKERAGAVDTIFKIRKKHKGIDYKELINHGRKY